MTPATNSSIMTMTRSRFAATTTAFAFSTTSNFFVIITLYALYIRLPQELSGSPFLSTQSLRLRFRGSFLAVAIVQLLVAIGTETAFAILSFVCQRDWSIYLLCSIVLSNMLRAVSQSLLSMTALIEQSVYGREVVGTLASVGSLHIL
ncbi:Uncharacterized protein HZ326_27307 [Fusarium oxysporum f. sp. albedinis]|nr:Uncharacterized protein HZ326_27307 [Fusarium oxysporum f. sp. albedinis]